MLTLMYRLGLSLPALGDEDRKNMFAAMDENGDGWPHFYCLILNHCFLCPFSSSPNQMYFSGAISFDEWLGFSMKTIISAIQ